MIALIWLVSFAHIPLANALVVLGDINNDGQIGLAESIYALQVTAGDATGGVEIFSKEFLVGKTLYVVVGDPDEMELHETVFLTDTVLLDGRTEHYEILEGGVLKIHDTFGCGLIFITALQAFENYIFASGNVTGSMFLFYDRDKAEEFIAPLDESACNPIAQASLRTGSPDCGGGEELGDTVYLRNFHDYFSVRATIKVEYDSGSTSTFESTVSADSEIAIGCTMALTEGKSYSIIDAEFQKP